MSGFLQETSNHSPYLHPGFYSTSKYQSNFLNIWVRSHLLSIHNPSMPSHFILNEIPVTCHNLQHPTMSFTDSASTTSYTPLWDLYLAPNCSSSPSMDPSQSLCTHCSHRITCSVPRTLLLMIALGLCPNVCLFFFFIRKDFHDSDKIPTWAPRY